MICIKCQFDNREGARFCKECGTNLEDACLKWRSVYQIGSRFCDECGDICEGQGYFSIGDRSAAIESFEQGVAVPADPFYSQWAKMLLAPTYLFNNQLEEAEKTLQEVWTYSNNFGCDMIAGYVKVWLALVSIIKGNMSKGIIMIEELKQVAIETERKSWMPFYESMLGNVYLQIAQGGEKRSLSFLFKNIGFLIKNALHPDRKAEAHFNKAIEQAKEIGDNGSLGRTHLNLGLLHKTKKRVNKAKECITKAINIFEETEAEGFLKQAREALKSMKN